MIEEDLKQILAECCERNDIREYDRPLVLAAVEKIWVERKMLSLLETKEMEICGLDSDGQLQWRATEFGKQNARKLIGGD